MRINMKDKTEALAIRDLGRREYLDGMTWAPLAEEKWVGGEQLRVSMGPRSPYVMRVPDGWTVSVGHTPIIYHVPDPGYNWWPAVIVWNKKVSEFLDERK